MMITMCSYCFTVSTTLCYYSTHGQCTELLSHPSYQPTLAVHQENITFNNVIIYVIIEIKIPARNCSNSGGFFEYGYVLVDASAYSSGYIILIMSYPVHAEIFPVFHFKVFVDDQQI